MRAVSLTGTSRAAVRRTDTVAAVTTTVICRVADAVSIGLAVT